MEQLIKIVIMKNHICSIATMYSENMSSSNNTTNQRVAVVTGSSTGIGFEIALALARNGFLTYATMRNLSKRDRIQSIANEEIAYSCNSVRCYR